ncbi:tubulin-folding cofactor B [Daphnia magna]|uniref:Tubulin-folding cofactor B n=1 Tax=Daphnia magna TaxID=35525 RepID=A0A0P5CX02_9CRUS|nr:tubulin-folding cofactor B [Daphnia magna]KZS20211.1 Tubulin-folding cofactor B [Daphnia magna]CAG4639531.1 EOG090X0DT2 [Daphnia magna]
MANFEVITQSTVNVVITSSISSFAVEKRYPKNISIGELKGKLELVTGASARSMILEVYDREKEFVCALTNDNTLLGSFPIDDGMRIHVNDSQLKKGEFEDVSKVAKFELSQEDYSKRSDSVKAFLERNRLGKYNEEEVKKKAEEQEAKETEEEKIANSLQVNQRCEVTVPGQACRRGAIKFIGKTNFKSGWWIGIHYDEPVGKNDGSVEGTRYFTCPMRYGAFVKPAHVNMGDFPELFDEEMDEM